MDSVNSIVQQFVTYLTATSETQSCTTDHSFYMKRCSDIPVCSWRRDTVTVAAVFAGISGLGVGLSELEDGNYQVLMESWQWPKIPTTRPLPLYSLHMHFTYPQTTMKAYYITSDSTVLLLLIWLPCGVEGPTHDSPSPG